MISPKPAVAATVAAIVICGCGSAVKPPEGHGKVDDPRVDHPNHVACLQQDHLAVQRLGRTRLQIGALPGGPTVVFEPTPGAAQATQIYGDSQGAEVIGSALLFDHAAADGELQAIENCLSQGVTG